MTYLKSISVASHYFVTDRSDAFIPATRLCNILDSLQQGRQLSSIALSYLEKQGFTALQRFAQRLVTYEEFCEVARTELAQREIAAEADKIVQEAKKKAREAALEVQSALVRQLAENARVARESDPQYIRKVKNQQLRDRYGIQGFIEEDCFGKLMDILRRIDAGNRLTDEDQLWLKTDGKEYYSDTIRSVFHEQEARFFASEYKRTKDPWMAVNASGHYRKCGQAKPAHDLLAPISVELQRSLKLKSALCTTHGGVMRDLEQFDKAMDLGQCAHALTPKDFRPCTLLGAVNMELGDFQAGQAWYKKAIERGACERAIDHDLRGIYLRADSAKRAEIRAFLLKEDSVRYRWVK
jgi:hypothetical protein